MTKIRHADCQKEKKRKGGRARGKKERSEPNEPKKMLIREVQFAYIVCQTYWQKCQKLNQKKPF